MTYLKGCWSLWEDASVQHQVPVQGDGAGAEGEEKQPQAATDIVSE